MSTNQKVVIGTRIYTNLYGKGFGTVYAINGEQSSEPVRRTLGGGAISQAGRNNADFDIVFDSGSRSLKLPECILRGVQWEILDDEPATAEHIANALAVAMLNETNAAAAKEISQQKFAATVEALKTDPAYKHLTPVTDNQGGKHVAKNIRAELKKAYPGVKFSVKSDYDSVRISWTDGPCTNEVEQNISNSYRNGSFNGMEDIYEYSRTPFTTVFGGVRYVNTSRETSPELVEKAIKALAEKYPGNFKDLIEQPTVEGYKKGAYYHVDLFGGGMGGCTNDSLQSQIYQMMQTTSA